jgi:hypothetical protein
MEILSTEGKRRIIIVTFFSCIQEKVMRRYGNVGAGEQATVAIFDGVGE